VVFLGITFALFCITSSPIEFNSTSETLRRAITNMLRERERESARKRTREISLTFVSR